MNKNDMTITTTPYGFSVEYCKGIVNRAEINTNTGNIRFYFPTSIISIDISNDVTLSTAYNAQFGITLSDDGHFFFIQSWEDGLFGFEVESGKLIWRHKETRAYNLVANGSVLICRFYNHHLRILDMATGDVVSNYPLRDNSVFLPLCDNCYLVGPKRGKYIMLDDQFLEIKKLPCQFLNPYALENFIIHKAIIEGGNLVITGVEYSNEAFAQARRSRRGNEFIRNSKFTRQILISD